jgi:hypothetical protein
MMKKVATHSRTHTCLISLNLSPKLLVYDATNDGFQLAWAPLTCGMHTWMDHTINCSTRRAMQQQHILESSGGMHTLRLKKIACLQSHRTRRDCEGLERKKNHLLNIGENCGLSLYFVAEQQTTWVGERRGADDLLERIL